MKKVYLRIKKKVHIKYFNTMYEESLFTDFKKKVHIKNLNTMYKESLFTDFFKSSYVQKMYVQKIFESVTGQS